VDLRHVLWIGGATGAGKSSIARTLAYRNDLQLYNVDLRTYEHVERPRPSGFAELSQDERWLEPPPEELVDRFVANAEERLPLILEDLDALPELAGVVAEGPFLLPSLIAPLVADGQALFLVPDEGRQRATLAARGSMSLTSDPERARANLTRRNMLLAGRIRDEAEACGLSVLEVDRPLEGMIERAGATLEPALSELPRIQNRHAVRRFENDVLANQVRLYRASGDAPPGEPKLPFACECDRPGCTDLVELTLGRYGRGAVVSAARDRSP
jgi:hypothetical protein